MKMVTCMGGIWKLSDRAYRRFLKDLAAGKESDLNDYGKMVGSDAIDVTDLTADGAKEILAGADPQYVVPSRDEEDE